MNGVSETSSLRAQLVQVVLCLAVPFMAVSAIAAEYSEAHDIPAVTSVLFTASSIALAVDRDSWGYRAATRTTYFIADRDSYSFQEVSEQEFNSLTMEEHVQSSVDENANSDINLLSTDDCKNKGYHYDSSDHEMTGRRILQLSSTVIDVEMLCRSDVSSAVPVDSSIWIGTYTEGNHGSYGSEGVLVVPKNGGPVAHLDIGRNIVYKVAVDPWSSNVWVVTRSQLFRVANDTAVLARYALYRDFDFDKQLPVVRVIESVKRVKSNPLAVLADWLGAASYRALLEASEAGVELPGDEPLYSYAMSGKYFSHRPQWPEGLIGALDDALPTHDWRRLACLLPGDKAKQLCTADLGEWPRAAGRYLKILQDRYPEFVVTGPIFGPESDTDLRRYRRSPGNFTDDILFGDFDSNGVRDFAAVLIEQRAALDPNLDESPIGFVVVCSGKLASQGLIEFSCSELTDREPEGFKAELDFFDWAPREGARFLRSPQSGDRHRQSCRYRSQINPFTVQTKKGKKKLSIMSSLGPCDWFFYHAGGTYSGCQYCTP